MATIYYSILNGSPPFVASLEISSLPNNNHSALGTYQFNDVPNGGYKLVVTDSNGCKFESNVGVNFTIVIPTTTTTTLPPTTFPPTTTTTTLPPTTAPPTTTTTTTTISPEVIVFGNSYNWWVAAHPLIAPAGWHVSTNTEWNNLGVAYGGVVSINSSSEKVNSPTKGLKSTGDTSSGGLWAVSSPATIGTDIHKFHVNPAGSINNVGISTDRSLYANYWTPDEVSSSIGIYKQFGYNNLYMYRSLTHYDKRYGFSIRFVKNTAIGWVSGNTLTDFDGNTYSAELMADGKVWMTENFRGQHYNNGVQIPVVTGSTAWSLRTTGAINIYIP